VPKHVVALYAINSIHISTIIELCQTVHARQSSLIINTKGMTKLMILRIAYRTMCCLEQRGDVEILHTDKFYHTFILR